MARKARLLITPDLLRELLSLPVGTEILGSGHYPGYVEIFLTHPDLADVPLTEGECPPLIRPKFMSPQPARLIDWGQS